ncbi:MAG: type I-G CRISPR-associated helicase/endonuclease Cas3g [Longimicrobiales bacterium]
MNSPESGMFANYFVDVHGYPPFPWQNRLAQQVIADGRWPDLLDLPTGTGKTCAIDVALFALAQRPEIFPRRIVLVVDRRVVVDQGAEHARRIQKALVNARGNAAADVAAALRRLFGASDDELPFTVSVLRGGMPRDESWAERPDRAVVALSTVDQVGSRLLFRGYGVSPRMASVHAGLLGNDTLFLLDEVQLSSAFAETLRVVQRRWRNWHACQGESPLPDRWAAVRMSATPIGDRTEEGTRFELDDDDRTHPVLLERLQARKLVSCEVVRVSNDEESRSKQFAEACVNAARDHVREGAVAVAVVVNRVHTARCIHRLLHEGTREFDVALLTGRMRPLDRDAILGRASDQGSLTSRIAAGRRRADERRPIVVVATQCIEAGADFDFDALVTECASLDALRQRFGRVDRRGERAETRSTVLVRHDQVGDNANDPIYGEALAATWTWLTTLAERGPEQAIDFGMSGFPDVADAEEKARLLSEVVHAPVLLPAHINAWVQTNPMPEPDPDVSLSLHGPDRDLPEVRLVWRADLDERTLNEKSNDQPAQREQLAKNLVDQLTICPPSSLESISLPLPAVRAWLARQAAEPFGDVEGARELEAEPRGDRDQTASVSRVCVRLRRGGAEIINGKSIVPGDTLIVPSSYGGIAYGNWDPDASAFVSDLGDWAQLVHRGRPVLRLVPEVLAGAAALADHEMGGEPAELTIASAAPWCSASHARDVPRATATDEDFDAGTAIADWIDSVREVGGAKLRAVLEAMDVAGFRRVEMGDGRFALVGRRRIDPGRYVAMAENTVGDILTEDDDSSSFTGREVTLRQHLSDVEEWTREFAKNIGLREDLTGDVTLAASLHDVGKADRRFQRLLAGGSEVRLALQSEPLAKSKGEARDSAARERARERAEYPRGYRHELLSVAMIQNTPGALDKARDHDLVLHLVASHHGWCRPLAPASDHGASMDVECRVNGLVVGADAAHGLARLDSEIVDRFFRLVDKYGWWGLSWLESIVRLADHRASEESCGPAGNRTLPSSDG